MPTSTLRFSKTGDKLFFQIGGIHSNCGDPLTPKNREIKVQIANYRKGKETVRGGDWEEWALSCSGTKDECNEQGDSIAAN